jgi:uncharacterized flavoprotein (TIGR03862 family)
VENKKNIAIVGGGPASLMLACSLDKSKYHISIYEKNSALGRKFLVAGKGGFNLTHSEELDAFTNRYHPKEFIAPFLKQFTNTDFRNWLTSIGIETYVGTSKRVFPKKGIKPIEVLSAIEKQLIKNQVSIHYNYTWKGWHQDELIFEHKQTTVNVKSDITVFALGGGSWKVTGSDGNWLDYFKEKKITALPFVPSNCAYKINWDAALINLIEGQALKNCEFTCGNISKKGEAVLTQFGIEGSGIYALSKPIREQLLSEKKTTITIDFKPDLSEAEIKNRLEDQTRLSIKEILEKKLNITNSQIQLLKHATDKEQYHSPDYLSKLIKAYPLLLTDFAPIDEAISTVGGIALTELNKHLELNKLPHHYCIGEMLDWDAPTGGYLLQACFSMGYSLAGHLNTI